MITDSDRVIYDNIMSAIVNKMNKVYSASLWNITKKIRHAIVAGLKETQEYDDLTKGILKAEFGFMIGEEEEKIDAIIERIAKSVTVEYTNLVYNGHSISGGVKINMLIKDYADILGLKEAWQNPEGYSHDPIPWLKWFITEGGQVVISDYSISYGVFEEARSGFALMYKGGHYIVPGDNSPNDNWLTRFFSSPTFQAYSQKIIGEVIKGAV